MRVNEQTISKVAGLLGKWGWQAKLKKYGLKKLQERMRKIGQQATGRPRLPDSQVTPGALYQRERRARLRAEARVRKGK